MRTPRIVFVGILVTATTSLVIVGLVALLFPSPAPDSTPRAARCAVVREPAPGATREVVVACTSTGEACDRGSDAARSLATKLAARVAVAGATDALERELLAAATDPDKVGLRVRLEARLREHPELAPGAVRAFSRLLDRETLFVVSRALVTCISRPDVRAAFDEAAAGGLAARREVALLALPADARAVELGRRGLEDVDAAPTVRAAGAYVVARAFDALPDAQRGPTLWTARRLASTPAEDAHLRAESLHLLARADDGTGAEAALAGEVLAESGAGAELALAAAHLALASGASPADVAAALARNPDPACAVAATCLTTPERNP